MTRRKVPDDRLISLVRDGGATWRYSALSAAITHTFNCREQTARLSLSRALRRGDLVVRDGFYGVAGRYDSNSPIPPALPAPGYAAPAITPLHTNRGTGDHFGHVHRLELLRRLQAKKQWRSMDIVAIACEHGATNFTALRTIKYALAYGYLTRENKRYSLTPLAIEQIGQYGQLQGVEGVTFARFCSRVPGRLIPQRDEAATDLEPLSSPE